MNTHEYISSSTLHRPTQPFVLSCAVLKVSGKPKMSQATHSHEPESTIHETLALTLTYVEWESVILFHAYIKWSWTVCPDLIMFNNLRSFTRVSPFFALLSFVDIH